MYGLTVYRNFNALKKMAFALAMGLGVQPIFAGVYIIADTTEEIAQIIENGQELLAEAVRNMGNEHLFAKPEHPSHMTFACVDWKTSLMKTIKEKFSQITLSLEKIASRHKPISLSSNIAEATLEVWPSKHPLKVAGKERCNYVWLVMKLSENAQLNSLAEDIQGVLKNEHAIEQFFPFSAHLTLGIVYKTDDSELSEDFIAGCLKDLSFENIKKPIILSRFKLSAHDENAKFELSF